LLTHNSIVRSTPKKQVHDSAHGGAQNGTPGMDQSQTMEEVSAVDFTYDAAGLDSLIAEALTWPGVYYARAWLNQGRLKIGDSLMYVLVGADIRPTCVDALQHLVTNIKTQLVTETEVFDQADC